MWGDDGDFRPGIIRWLEEIRTEVLDSEEHVLNMVAIHAQGMTYGTQSSVFETGIDDKLSLNMVMSVMIMRVSPLWWMWLRARIKP